MKRLIFLTFIFIFTFSVLSLDLLKELKGLSLEHKEIFEDSTYNISFLDRFIENKSKEELSGKKSMFFLKAKTLKPKDLYLEITSILIQNKFDLICHNNGSAYGEDFPAVFYKSNPFLEDYAYNNSAPFVQGDYQSQYFLFAEKKLQSKKTYVSVYISQGWWTYPIVKLDVVESEL